MKLSMQQYILSVGVEFLYALFVKSTSADEDMLNNTSS